MAKFQDIKAKIHPDQMVKNGWEGAGRRIIFSHELASLSPDP